jgi:hypothetical protein
MHGYDFFVEITKTLFTLFKTTKGYFPGSFSLQWIIIKQICMYMMYASLSYYCVVVNITSNDVFRNRFYEKVFRKKYLFLFVQNIISNNIGPAISMRMSNDMYGDWKYIINERREV